MLNVELWLRNSCTQKQIKLDDDSKEVETTPKIIQGFMPSMTKTVGDDSVYDIDVVVGNTIAVEWKVRNTKATTDTQDIYVYVYLDGVLIEFSGPAFEQTNIGPDGEWTHDGSVDTSSPNGPGTYRFVISTEDFSASQEVEVVDDPT